MGKKFYNKLIRDRIPEIIHASGSQYEISVMDDVEYIQALRLKLVEEAQEAQQANLEDLPTELADIQEVITTLMTVCNISPEQVNLLQINRRIERGAFTKKLKLIWSG